MYRRYVKNLKFSLKHNFIISQKSCKKQIGPNRVKLLKYQAPDGYCGSSKVTKGLESRECKFLRVALTTVNDGELF
jgi:hypothetical protein